MEVRLGKDAKGPLAGMRVLDLSTVVSGPLCSQNLGDLGAEVTKVEAPAGDTSRRMGPPFTAGISPLFAHCNRNKRSIVIDLKNDEGRAVARRLASAADVLIENFRPGVAARLGLAYEDLERENPGLVYVSINGFGPSGPYRDHPAYDTVIQGLTGFLPIQGGTGEPQLVRAIAADKSSALTATYAVLGALLARERGDGRGQHVEIPMLDAYAAFALPDTLAVRTFPDDDSPMPFDLSEIHRTWKTADGYVVMMVVEDRQFHAICRALGRDDLIDDPRCGNLVQRISNARELFALLEEEIAKWPTTELVERARQQGAPLAPVNDLDAFLADPQVQSNETVVETTHVEAGRMRLLRSPVRYARTPTSLRRLPPTHGEQTEEVLREAGYDEEAIRRLREASVVS
jgi:crotonobetainyl-CoA:carnitine CoA-transferase CaiB-like acyl-CoA transferase